MAQQAKRTAPSAPRTSRSDDHEEGVTRYTILFAFMATLLFVTAMAYVFGRA